MKQIILKCSDVFYRCNVAPNAVAFLSNDANAKAIWKMLVDNGVVPHSSISSGGLVYESWKFVLTRPMLQSLLYLFALELRIKTPAVSDMQTAGTACDSETRSPAAKKAYMAPSTPKKEDQHIELCDKIGGLTPFKDDTQNICDNGNNNDDDLDLGVSALAWQEETSVKVYNIPPTAYNVDIFKTFLHGVLKNVIDCGVESLIIGEYQPTSETLVIQFPDGQSAAHFAALKEISYVGYNLKVELVPVLEQSVMPEELVCVEISQVPPAAYNLDIFKVFLKNILKGVTDCGVESPKIGEYQATSETLVIQFSDGQSAAHFAALKEILYVGYNLKVKLVPVLEQSVMPEELVCVEISQVPPAAYNLDIFKVFLKNILKGVTDCGVESLKIGEYQATSETLVIQFPDGQSAAHFAALKEILYVGYNLKVKLVPALEQSVMPEELVCVEISQVPPAAYNLDIFKVFLKNILKGVTDCGVESLKIGEYQATSETLVIQFPDAQSAAQFATLKRISYLGYHLSVVVVPLAKQSGTADMTSHDNFEFLDIKRAPDRSLILPQGKRLRHDWPHLQTLQLIEACLAVKNNLKSTATRLVGTAWGNVQMHLWRRGSFYSLKVIKKKWKALKTAYESFPEDWQYRHYLDDFQSDEQNKTLGLLEEEMIKVSKVPLPQKMPKPTGAKMICGILLPEGCNAAERADLWNEDLTFKLISEYNARRCLFDDDKHRASGLYREIRDAFHKLGHKHISSDNCAERMAWLSLEFNRRYDMTLHCTGIGADVINWVYYDQMGRLKGDKASTMPHKLMSFGTSTVTRVRKSSPEEHIDDPLSTSTPARTGRKRVDAVKRRLIGNTPAATFKNEKIAVGNRIAAQFERFNDILLSKQDKPV